MLTPPARHLARLLEVSPDGADAAATLARAAAAAPDRVAARLVDEAFANDDVTGALAAQTFVAERLSEWADLLDPDLRRRIASLAAEVIARRAP